MQSDVGQQAAFVNSVYAKVLRILMHNLVTAGALPKGTAIGMAQDAERELRNGTANGDLCDSAALGFAKLARDISVTPSR